MKGITLTVLGRTLHVGIAAVRAGVTLAADVPRRAARLVVLEPGASLCHVIGSDARCVQTTSADVKVHHESEASLVLQTVGGTGET